MNRSPTRFLGFEAFDVIVEKLLHSVQVTSFTIIDLHFVEDDSEKPVTVKQERYTKNIIVTVVR